MIEDKIEEAKNCFVGIKKSGKNNYQKFQYFETKDIFPIVRKICKEFKIRTNFSWNDEENRIYLKLTDQEDKSEYLTYIPVSPVTTNDVGKYMQDIGRIQTYAMRYLYLEVFEIVTPDEIDNQDQSKIKSKPKKMDKINEIKKDSPSSNISDERVYQILDEAYQKVTIEAGKEFNLATGLWTLKRLCKNDDELKACKNSFDKYMKDSGNL